MSVAQNQLHHIKRANYLSYIQNNFSLNNHPSPINNGWHIENSVCLPTKSTLLLLPPNAQIYSRKSLNIDERDEDTTSSISDDSDNENYV